MVAEIDAFCCAARCIVFGVEIDHQIFAFVIREFERPDSRFGGEIVNDLVELDFFF